MTDVRTTWTEDKLEELRALRSQGLTQKAIAEEMGLRRGQVEAGMAYLRHAGHVIIRSEGGGGSGVPRTLKDFVKDQKRAACKVCQLALDAKDQLRELAGIKREVVVEWLRADYNATVTVDDIDRHRNERH